MTDRVVSVPVRLRRVCYVLAAAIIVLFAVLAVALSAGSAGSGSIGGPTGRPSRQFGAADQWTVFGFGVVAAALVLLFTRPRLEADLTGLRIRNVVRSHVVP